MGGVVSFGLGLWTLDLYSPSNLNVRTMIARGLTIPARKESEMNIGIIGAGHIGGTLTRRLTALGHKVFVANSRGPESLADLARETGATPVTVDEAARNRDI